MEILILKKLIHILNLPRYLKTFIAIIIDSTCCVFSVWFSYYLRLGNLLLFNQTGFKALFLALFISIPIFLIFGLYKNIFRYSGLHTLLNVSKAISVFGLFYCTFVSFLGVQGIPRTIGLIQPLLFLFLIISWRILARYILRGINEKISIKKDAVKALVYGSGDAGRQLVKAMQESSEISIKGFLDDDLNKQDCVIDGKRIYSPKQLDNLITKKNISLILIALPSINRRKRSKIIRNLLHYKISIRSIPDISNLASGKSLITEFVDLEIDDLLGRIPVEPFQSLMKRNIFSKTILVTGAGGSIGSELCLQIIKHQPKKLLLVEISEYALYSIHEELEEYGNINTEVNSNWRLNI